MDVILELTCLSDLMRIIGVGPVSARLLYDAGICSEAEFTELSIDESVDLLNRAIEANPQYNAPKMKTSDMDYCMETAVLLPVVLVNEVA